jgi:Acetyltransferase (GNAT) domain
MPQIALLQRQQINDSLWDDFIEHSPQNILYAQSWYLDTVAARWAALVVIDEQGWVAVLPVPLRRKFGFWVVQQPLFCQILGVFFRDNTINANISEQLSQKLLAEYRYISTYAGRFLGTKCTHFTHILDLTQNYETLKSNYSTDRKTNLKKAQKHNWQIVESVDIEPLIAIFKQNHAHKIDGGVSESGYDLLRNIFKKLTEKKAVRLAYTIKNNQIEAGCLFAIYGGRIIYIFNSATQTGRQHNARTLLIDNVLEQYAASDCIFDFESPMIESINDFYASFGTEKVYFTTIQQNNLPFPLKQIQDWRLEK